MLDQEPIGALATIADPATTAVVVRKPNRYVCGDADQMTSRSSDPRLRIWGSGVRISSGVLRTSLGIPLVWVFNIWGSADLLNEFYQANAAGLLPGELGAAFCIPIAIVPLLLVTHALMSASITMAGMIIVLLGGVFMAIGPPLKTSSSLGSKTFGQLGPVKVRVVGATPREEVSCEQQTWPNIAQRCLVRSSAGASTDRTSPAAPGNAKLSPLTATGNAVAPAPAAADRTAPNNPMTEQQAVRAPMRSEAKVGYGTDEIDELPPQLLAEPVRKRAHRHSGFPLKFPFRF